MTLPRFFTKKRAFTLIELLITITIIAILIAISTAYLTNAAQKGRDSKRKTDLKNIKAALELYFQINGNYPKPAAPCSSSTDCYSNSGDSWIPALSPKFINKVPQDPLVVGSIENFLAKNIIVDMNLVKTAYAGNFCPIGNCGSPAPPSSGSCSSPPSNKVYCYMTNTSNTTYELWAILENTNDPDINTKSTATCQDTAPASTPFNYCVKTE